MVDATLEPPNIKVAPYLVTDSKHARKAAMNLVDHMDEVSAETIAKAVVARRALLCSIDACFKVEECFFVSLKDELGLQVAETRISDTLPTSDTNLTVADSPAKLDYLSGTTLSVSVDEASARPSGSGWLR